MKFIRSGQHFIEKNGEGVLAFITEDNTSVLSNAAEESTYGKTAGFLSMKPNISTVSSKSPGTSTSAATNPLKNGSKTEKDETLTFEDICHYQKIIVSLC